MKISGWRIFVGIWICSQPWFIAFHKLVVCTTRSLDKDGFDETKFFVTPQRPWPGLWGISRHQMCSTHGMSWVGVIWYDWLCLPVLLNHYHSLFGDLMCTVPWFTPHIKALTNKYDLSIHCFLPSFIVLFDSNRTGCRIINIKSSHFLRKKPGLFPVDKA